MIAFSTLAKVPGEARVGENVELVARHYSGDEVAPYERLLGDALRGDAVLIAREDAVEAEWRVVDPILGDATPIHEYAPHGWGPREADRVIARDGGWHTPMPHGVTR